MKKKEIKNKEKKLLVEQKEKLKATKKVKNGSGTEPKKLTEKEILDLNADEVIEMIEQDFNYREIAKKFLVDLSVVNYFVNHSQHSASAREALQNSADRAFDKAEEAILEIDDEATQAAVARQRELAHHYRKKAAIKNRNKFSESHKIQAEVKDTSSTSAWLSEVLSNIDNNK